MLRARSGSDAIRLHKSSFSQGHPATLSRVRQGSRNTAATRRVPSMSGDVHDRSSAVSARHCANESKAAARSLYRLELTVSVLLAWRASDSTTRSVTRSGIVCMRSDARRGMRAIESSNAALVNSALQL
jgi:hypothetical protein